MTETKKKTIDARGLFCPGPTQVLRGINKQLEPGTVIELLVDDPASIDQVKSWCESTGNELQSVSQDANNEITFTILKKT